MKIHRLGLLILLLAFLSACSQKYDSKEEILAKISSPAFPEKEYVISDFGAIGDSVTDCKPAFEKAIQQCASEGGGKINIPAGNYILNGPIHFESNINLHLSQGAILRFSSNPKFYLPVVKTSWEGTLVYNYSPFIYAYQKENIAITGKGTIDGEASETWSLWKQKQKNDQLLTRDMNHHGVPVEERIFGEGHFLRPQLIQFFECKNILVEDVKIEDSPFWCVHLLKCKNATLRGMHYDAQNKNNDGIDPEYSQDILIENIVFNNNDDNVAIKAGRDHEGRATQQPSQNIIIRNCKLKGLHAIVMGSEMSSGVHNIFVEDCETWGYLKRGIYLKSNPDRGGEISHVYVNNVSFNEVLDCFMVTSNYHNEGEGYTTNIHDIYLNGISCKKANGYGIYINGLEQKYVHDFYLTDFKVDSANESVYVNYAEKINFKNVNVNNQEVLWDPETLKLNPSSAYDY